jgi:hypothetical protein
MEKQENWENEVDSWIFDFSDDGKAGMFLNPEKTIFCWNPQDKIKSILANVSNQTLEAAAEALEKEKVEHAHKKMCKIDSYGCEADQEYKISMNACISSDQSIIRSLKK